MRNLIQIAGVRNADEAKMLLDCGADFIGFPLRLAYHQPDLPEKQVAEIIAQLSCSSKSVLITYLDDAKTIADLCHLLKMPNVQLHGAIDPSEVQNLCNLAPNLFIVKSLIIRSGNFDELRQTVDRFERLADAFITDTYDPATGATGATGKTHDWEISRRLVEYSPKPVFLAGGLNPLNVQEAILTVRPAGVDAHTGLENSRGDKDPHLVLRFIMAARQAFNKVSETEQEPLALPIDGVLDLHTFSPQEIKALIPDYLAACLEAGLFDVRIIHGKGTGALRETVHSILGRLTCVAEFHLADESGGHWGATTVRLKK